MDFTISLAHVNIRIKSLYEEVYQLCKDYLLCSGEEAEVTVVTTREDVLREREKLKEDDHGKPSLVRDSYLETLAVYRKIAEAMTEWNAWLMHGTAVCLKEKTVLFTAPSGTGKSTHARLWLSCFPEAFVVNGDKPLLRRREEHYEVCGTPWAGKEGWNRNTQKPLAAVCLLERDSFNRIEKISFAEALPALIRQSYRPELPERLHNTLNLIRGMENSVDFFRLGCNLENEAALVAYRGIFGAEP